MKGLALFLLAFLILYGGLHAYAFLKVRAAFPIPPPLHVGLVLLLGLLFLAPLLIRYSERAGFETLARGLSHVGYGWMGFLFLFCAAALCVDLYRVLISAGGVAFKQTFAPLLPSPRLAFLIPLIVAAVATAYGYGEALSIRTERLETPRRGGSPADRPDLRHPYRPDRPGGPARPDRGGGAGGRAGHRGVHGGPGG